MGWRLGLQAVTGLVSISFFMGLLYRPASLYHPQRRAILHLKNQRKKVIYDTVFFFILERENERMFFRCFVLLFTSESTILILRECFKIVCIMDYVIMERLWCHFFSLNAIKAAFLYFDRNQILNLNLKTNSLEKSKEM